MVERPTLKREVFKVAFLWTMYLLFIVLVDIKGVVVRLDTTENVSTVTLIHKAYPKV